MDKYLLVGLGISNKSAYNALVNRGYYVDVLVDKAIVDDEEVVKVLKEFDEIKTYHDIRSRGSENNIHLDMHIMVDPSMTVEDAHRLSHDIEDRIREITNENSQVIVHIEPYYEKSRA